MFPASVSTRFFDRDALEVARDLLGKVLAHRVDGVWLKATIVETEAYYLQEKGSHASLGYTEKRKALFMPPGTIYMYYARGGDSLNFSCRGAGNAVLVKSGCPFQDGADSQSMLERMHRLNPLPDGSHRADGRLCSGQTLLCRALGLRVPDWDGGRLDRGKFRLLDVGYAPQRIVCAPRLGIPQGRDPHLPYRFIDFEHLRSATRNPLAGGAREGKDYRVMLNA
ncbi:MAG: DNA-3-methyladenine glycosylase [SAR324 cluster bacterium]|nr:DNA-3-methyladenine glycosylase [SAR324 cluster bacterium]